MGSYYSTSQNVTESPKVSSTSPDNVNDKKDINQEQNEILRSVISSTICLIQNGHGKKNDKGDYYDLTYIYDKLKASIYVSQINNFSQLLLEELKNKYSNMRFDLVETESGQMRLYSNSNININQIKDNNRRKNKINKIKLSIRSKLQEREDIPTINTLAPIILVEN